MKIYFYGVGARRFTIKKVLNGAIKYLGQPSKQLEMSLSLVSQEEIRSLNKQFRNVDSVTDVLSFPSIDNPERKVLDFGSFSMDAINPETNRINLGDVIICLDRAKEQAVSYGHSLKRELCFLALHGMLHLLGYDHMTETDEKQMFSLQENILSSLGIERK